MKTSFISAGAVSSILLCAATAEVAAATVVSLTPDQVVADYTADAQAAIKRYNKFDDYRITGIVDLVHSDSVDTYVVLKTSGSKGLELEMQSGSANASRAFTRNTDITATCHAIAPFAKEGAIQLKACFLEKQK